MDQPPSPKRAYAAPERVGKDVDQAQRAIRIKKAVYSLSGGVVGALAGGFVGFGRLPGFLAGALLVYLIASAVEGSAASLFGRIYNPRSGSKSRKREYSYAESLAVRGLYDQAIEAYEVALSEFPEDPEPYARIARIYRDKLRRYEEAVFWFKRARTDAAPDRGGELLMSQEIIEIYARRLGTPERAVPELARLTDRFPDDPVADWARDEIVRLRESTGEE
jgi:tetratricopeptide (TPR) repeat protein